VAVNAIVMGEIFYLFITRSTVTSCSRHPVAYAPLLDRARRSFRSPSRLRCKRCSPTRRCSSNGSAPPPDAATWGRILLFGALLFVAVEIEKAWLRHRK